MTLDKVKYIKCNECGRGMPLAHWVPHTVNHFNFAEKPEQYKKHKNMRCACCIRAEMVSLKNDGTRDAMTRFHKLAKMLGAA